MVEKSLLAQDLLLSLGESSVDSILVLNCELEVEFFNTFYSDYFLNCFKKNIAHSNHLPTLLQDYPRQLLAWQDGWDTAFKGNTFRKVSQSQTADGENRYYELSFIPIHNIYGKITGATQLIKDVTNYKRLENQAEVYKNFYRLANSLPQIVWTATPDGLLDYFNDQWFIYSGMTYLDSVGQGWASALYEEDLAHLTQVWTDCLHTGNQYHVQARVRNKEGHYRWLLIRALPYRNAQNEIVHWYGTCTDFEDQKDSELQLKRITQELKMANEEIYFRNQRLTKINADLDNFVYTASHDLKAPIYNIESLVSSLHEAFQAPLLNMEEPLLLLKMIDQSVEILKNTIHDLTEVAKVQNEDEDDHEEIVFEKLLKEVRQTLNGLITKYNAVVTCDFSKAPRIKFSMKNMRSIFYNIISNGIKYSDSNRMPHIHLETNLIQGDYLQLFIKDNGLGIKETDKEKVFKIFKRLHVHVEGSGIGMSIVKRIIDNHGGKIEIESEVGVGTTFNLYFPLHTA